MIKLPTVTSPVLNIIAPKGLLCRGVQKSMFVSPCVRPSVRDEIGTWHEMRHRFRRFACNADDQGPKTGSLRTRAVWGEKVSLI